MKKIILISMIASGMLLAETVNELTTNINNNINNGLSAGINNANVSQGHTIVSGDSDIDTLNITQTVNEINSVAIDSATVNQGLTEINDGSVSDTSLTSTNIIKDSAVRTGATVNQASTIVNGGAELEDTTVTSTNTLMGIVENDADVSQATLELNGDNTELNNDSELTSTNSIIANIDASEVHQARVRVGGGYTVSTLLMSEVNALTGDITGGSSVIQGGLDVCSHGGDASDWCED